MKKITPFLWFNTQAEEAAHFYVSIFNNSTMLDVRHSGAAEQGAVMSASFSLDGQEFIAFNGGPHFTFTPAISLFVNCETQQEVDALWDKLSAGGATSRCGWLQDKYGLSWQIIPAILGKLLQDPDPVKVQKAMQAMLRMDKIDIAALNASVAN